jgi:hypothetical protein
MYPVTTEAKQTEIHIIKNILQRNEYNANLIEKAVTIMKTHMKNLNKTQNGPPSHIVVKK